MREPKYLAFSWLFKKEKKSFVTVVSTLCTRPLPEDDPVESDILAAAGTESEAGKNIPLQSS